MDWIQFVRKYGPIPRNENMYDESIQRAARRARMRPITFEHPLHKAVLSSFDPSSEPISIVLTGTAGDGKTHLCREVWQKLTGERGGLDEPYVTVKAPSARFQTVTVHIIKDLSEWAPQRGAPWEPEKEQLLRKFCRSIFAPDSSDVFLLAANDGQLVESWRRLADEEYVTKTRKLFETLLVENKEQVSGARVTLFNLSRGSSAVLFDRALEGFLSHEGWTDCSRGTPGEHDFFGSNCPIRHNYELLQSPLLQRRLRALVELCDFNDLHLPIRQILLLLSNALLGHPDVKDCLMQSTDIPTLVRAGSVSRASIYNNIFGGNLPENRREAITVFDYLDRFRIGHETTNRVDNILIFGEADEKFRSAYRELIASDRFYGADEAYRAAQVDYIEGVNEDERRQKPFLQMLVGKRRGLFFTIPESQEEELGLWEMTVFKYAGEYRSRLLPSLRAGRVVEHPILARLVKGLNRIFSGMLVTGDRELLLSTSLSFSHAKISRLLEDRVSVRPRLHERVEIVLENGMPSLRVWFTNTVNRSMDLHLVRYEFLSRVAEGALPSSFSRECYEDILAFKSQLLAAVAERQQAHGQQATDNLVTVRLLSLDDSGNPLEELIEVTND
jgi:hypothetical protein